MHRPLPLNLRSSPPISQICHNQPSGHGGQKGQVSLEASADLLLEPLSCLPVKVGRGVAGLWWGLRCLLFPFSVCVLRLILGARQGSDDEKGMGHHQGAWPPDFHSPTYRETKKEGPVRMGAGLWPAPPAARRPSHTTGLRVRGFTHLLLGVAP